MNWLNELKTDRNDLRQAKREWRNNHFLPWLGDRVTNVIFIGLILLVGFIGGAGFLDVDASGARTIIGINLDDGRWNLIDDTDKNSIHDESWAKRKYLECSYDSFAGPIIRRYWIGQEIESSRKLSKFELLEFEKSLTDHFGESFRTFERERYDQEMASPAVKLSKACPFWGNDAID